MRILLYRYGLNKLKQIWFVILPMSTKTLRHMPTAVQFLFCSNCKKWRCLSRLMGSFNDCKRQELLTLRENLGSPSDFWRVRSAHLIFSWCCVCVFVCVPFSCLPNVASVSGLSILDCPFGFF